MQKDENQELFDSERREEMVKLSDMIQTVLNPKKKNVDFSQWHRGFDWSVAQSSDEEEVSTTIRSSSRSSSRASSRSSSRASGGRLTPVNGSGKSPGKSPGKGKAKRRRKSSVAGRPPRG
eukprot:TRINITY_DN6344_c0_g1_i2.p2 TRINITY_DN6344_c0_g1~~TRINITY_DN6344_c0_g1_i2.p2  ORF type:complete len:120 (+),score=48.78 TRINITY_DN6344_c0_g1_i2:198-557(+)